MVKTTMVVFAVLVALMVSTAFAGDVGRFQAIRVKDASTFILDTKEGHMWVWTLRVGLSGRRQARQNHGGSGSL
jgi:hypothetical protein